ncbi:MarR family winged helix-turn-helix transcriptional regulator [Lutimaribacter saemankumensis]|uniref:DNA-binding transcriptional regulator, MarR family n=1 Tax=Lutimaribacter saemankumensis TaxID=490829 RepID=A0A1G8JZT0_9RHOB|nr:MarR family winged helix-turn-helix transcriptional regulator [Lutimaribacter saemankumensis]SDI36726.1 DNA-binding transcriptional regulator, MarR family [Lutimaribacter saemankumensis]
MQNATAPHDEGAEGEEGFVSNYLLYLLAAASEAASAQFHAEVRQKGLRVPEWRVLAWLHDRDGEMITRLARISLIEQSRLTKIIIQMEERGLVTRQGDAQDRRRVRVWLTNKGRTLAQGLVADARIHEAQVLSILEGGDGARLKPALSALLRELDPESRG